MAFPLESANFGSRFYGGEILILLLIGFFSSAPVYGQSQCTQKLSELPAAAELLGFHLGMTKDEVKIRVPQAVFGHTDDFGISKTTINPDFDPRIDKTKFEGVRSISLDFLDGRLTSLWIGYDGTFKVQTVEDFAKTLSLSLYLPNGWSSWKFRGQQMRCADFQITVSTVAGGPSFRILDETAEDAVASRRAAKEEQESATETTESNAKEEPLEIIGDKHTKTYYPAGCKPAKEISEVYRIGFKSTEDAERAGFKVANTCR
jgi:hypothetical protein